MSNLETTEPDPAATSIPNDETVNKTGEESSAPTDVAAVMAEAQPEAQKEEKIDTEMGNNSVANPTNENGDDASAKKENGNQKSEKKHYSEKRQYNNRNGDDRRGGYQSRRNQAKYDPSVLEPSEDPVLMRGQVEFYFSDSNLPTDEHLWELTDGTSNKPVSIKEIHKTFKRMKRFESYEKVVAALKESKFLRVEGEEGAETVNRKVSYNPKSSGTTTSREPRFLYVKGFGDEEAGTQFDIEAYFNAHGPTNGVRLRRASDDRTFKGSVFVEFQDDETANLFLALNPAPLFKGKHKLEAMSKASYCEKKEKDIRDGVIVPSQSWGPPGRGRGRGRGRGHNNRGDRHREHRDRGDRDPDDWKKRREDDRSSGFKDSRGRNRGGRGGRGKRDDRGPRKNDRNRERDGDKDTKAESSPANDAKKDEETPTNDVKKDVETPSTEAKKAEETPSKNDRKRSRDEDEVGEGGPAKKVDSKSEVAVEASS